MTEKKSSDPSMWHKLGLYKSFITGKPNVPNCNDAWRFGLPNVVQNWYINVKGSSFFDLPKNTQGNSSMPEPFGRVLGENTSNIEFGYETPEETFE